MKYAFFKGKIVPFTKAKISIMTHAFNYGTGCFEGIRGYWNGEKKQMYILKLKEHYQRMSQSASALKIKIKYSLPELVKITIELVKRNAYKEDIYIRPIAYKSQEKIGLGLNGVKDDFCIFVAPFGAYLDVSKGIRVCISSWRRLSKNNMPLGAKITGVYFNSSLAKAEAIEKGFDEAIMLSAEGAVAEGSGENIFVVKERKLVTPPLTENILPGITRASLINLAKDELGIDTFERRITKEELYQADEVFLCGTGAQVSPVIEIDGKKIGPGKVGRVTKSLQDIYFDCVRGRNKKYLNWVTHVGN